MQQLIRIKAGGQRTDQLIYKAVIIATEFLVHDKHGLLSAPISTLLPRLAIPMGIGLSAILLLNLVDTWFISLLGTQALAAISFTFPVTFAVTAMAMGTGLGLSSRLANQLGQRNSQCARRLTSDGLALATLMVLLIAGLGLTFLEPLFGILGATDELMPMIRDYMRVWFVGVPLLVLPIVSNAAIRATGDTRTPSRMMLIAGLINGVLTPLLMFGPGPLPALGIKGAALGSVISWLYGCVRSLTILYKREHLLTLKGLWHKDLLPHWQQVLRIGLPASVTNLLAPLAHAWLLWLLAREGAHAVAAYGAASRLESLALIGLMALSSVMAPLVAQNLGGNQPARCREALSMAMKLSFWGQGIVYAGLFVLTPLLARLFSQDPGVYDLLTQYLYLVPLSYGLQGMLMILGATLNGANHPWHALGLNLSRLALVLVLSGLGFLLGDSQGAFIGIALGNAFAGLLAWGLAPRIPLEQTSSTPSAVNDW